MTTKTHEHTLPVHDMARHTDAFGQALVTGENMQVVAVSIAPGEEIGAEVHDDHDRVLVFVEGSGEAGFDGRSTPVGPNDLTFVRAGTRHSFVRTGSIPLRLFTRYAPPEHAHGTRHADKAAADAAEHGH